MEGDSCGGQSPLSEVHPAGDRIFVQRKFSPQQQPSSSSHCTISSTSPTILIPPTTTTSSPALSRESSQHRSRPPHPFAISTTPPIPPPPTTILTIKPKITRASNNYKTTTRKTLTSTATTTTPTPALSRESSHQHSCLPPHPVTISRTIEMQVKLGLSHLASDNKRQKYIGNTSKVQKCKNRQPFFAKIRKA